MTQLLELREKIRSLYYEHDFIFRGIGKFLLAFCVFFAVVYQVGYAGVILTPVIALCVAAFCIFLPAGAVSFFMCVVTVGSLWKISMEVGVTAAFLFLLMALLYFVFKPRNSVLMAITMFACTFNMGGILPIAVGLLFDPLALIPMCFGVLSYNMIVTARANFSILSSQSVRLSEIEKVVYYADCLIQNKKVLLLIAAFSLTVLVVYFIRRRPRSYAWSVAIPSGLMVLVLVLLIGNVIFDISIIAPALIISCILGVLAACIAMLFQFVLDGSRTEYLEFEDDEYYYYVKAIPKVSVTVSEKRVTNITRKSEDDEEMQDDWQSGMDDDIMLPQDELPLWEEDQKDSSMENE